MIRYETTNWPSSRRCGCIHDSYYAITGSRGWRHVVASATNDGDYIHIADTREQRCNCTIKYGPSSDISADTIYIALCSTVGYGGSDGYDQRIATNSDTCPKGWGKLKERYPNDTYSVRNAQGYVKNGQMPVYGYVTRYRSAYHNYIAGRVSKA